MSKSRTRRERRSHGGDERSLVLSELLFLDRPCPQKSLPLSHGRPLIPLTLVHPPSADSKSEFPELGDAASGAFVGREAAAEHTHGGVGEREDVLEHGRVLDVGVEGRIGGRGELPRVSSGDEVDEHDAERPDVVRFRRVRGIGRRGSGSVVAVRTDVKTGTAAKL